VAEVFGGELGQAYLGTQGDVWDAHKDMALATTSAVISMTLVAAVNWRFSLRFGEELRGSLTVKQQSPLGERKLFRWLRAGRAQTRVERAGGGLHFCPQG